MEIQKEVWYYISRQVHKCSFNLRHKLSLFKMIHRIYYTPEKLHKMNSEMSFLCWRFFTCLGHVTYSPSVGILLAGIQTRDVPIIRRPALPTEPQPPLGSVLFIVSGLFPTFFILWCVLFVSYFSCQCLFRLEDICVGIILVL